jgi:hypothetical protein
LEDAWVSGFLEALERPGDLTDLTPDVVDKALWNVSSALDEVLTFGRVSVYGRISVVRHLPDFLERLDAAGFGSVTAFSYFWEGFVGLADAMDEEVQTEILTGLRRLAGHGTEATFWTVLQGLARMHGTPGAAALAGELTERRDLSAEAHEYLARVHSELLTMEERLRGH